MKCLLDVNLLMALLWENHEHHQTVRRWLRNVSLFTTCFVTQLGFARVSSHPILRNHRPQVLARPTYRVYATIAKPQLNSAHAEGSGTTVY